MGFLHLQTVHNLHESFFNTIRHHITTCNSTFYRTSGIMSFTFSAEASSLSCEAHKFHMHGYRSYPAYRLCPGCGVYSPQLINATARATHPVMTIVFYHQIFFHFKLNNLLSIKLILILTLTCLHVRYFFSSQTSSYPYHIFQATILFLYIVRLLLLHQYCLKKQSLPASFVLSVHSSAITNVSSVDRGLK